MRHFLDFEKPIAVLEGKIEELRHMSSDVDINIADEVSRLQERMTREIKSTYAKLGPWDKVQVARHPDRPKTEMIVIATKTAVKKVVVKTDVAARNLAKTTTPQIMELKRAPIRIKTLQ